MDILNIVIQIDSTVLFSVQNLKANINPTIAQINDEKINPVFLFGYNRRTYT